MSGPQEFTGLLLGMDGLPPNYEDVAISFSTKPRLLVRLEVWHFSSNGRSQDNNDNLAEAFREADPDNWNVQDVAVIEPDGAANRDNFVPIQVDFEHKKYTDDDPNGRAQNHVRDLFRRITPAVIFQFFLSMDSKPHAVNLVARNVAPLHQQRYCQLFIINKLKLPTPAEMGNTDEIANRLSNIPKDLSTLSQMVEISSVYQLLHKQAEPQSPFNHVQDAESLAMIAEALRNSYEANMNQEAAGESATPLAWVSAVAPFKKFQTEFANVVGNLERIKGGKSATPQVLYETGLNLHTYSLILSRARNFLGPYLENQIEQYEKSMVRPKNLCLGGVVSGICGAGTGGAILLGGLASNPFTWTIAIILCAGALITTGAVQSDICTISEKREAVKKFQQDLKDIADVLDEARISVAVTICRDVFTTELDNLGQHEQNTILGSFGIDVSSLDNGEYCESLVESRIDKVMDYYKEMATNFEHMVKVCGLDVNDAKMPL